MTKPLALLLHDKLMPGAQLVTKFEQLDYRVSTIADPAELAAAAQRERPMLVVADLDNRRGDVLAAIASLLALEPTSHVPVIAYAAREDEKVREASLKAGVKVFATYATIVPHLGQFLEHALLVD